MLNYKEYDIGRIEYEIGYCLGAAESRCNTMSYLNRLKDINIEKMVKIIGDEMPMEQYQELMMYRKMYPGISTRKLIEKLAKESEYKYV